MYVILLRLLRSGQKVQFDRVRVNVCEGFLLYLLPPMRYCSFHLFPEHIMGVQAGPPCGCLVRCVIFHSVLNYFQLFFVILLAPVNKIVQVDIHFFL